jgi:transketolase
MDVTAPMVPLDLPDLARMAARNRIDAARMFMAAGNGHFGSCFSCADIITALYFALMRVDAANPDWPYRDRFLLSKGHAAPALYSALIRRGFFAEEWIDEYETHVGSRLMTHPSRRYQPGVDASLGALGHGLSIGVGMALAGRMDGRDYNVYVLMGDGEINEGSVWEAAASAAKFGLGNLVGIVDSNRLCVDGWLEDVMPMEPLVDKWRAFGWDVLRIDGHDMGALLTALAPRRDVALAAPRMVIADTVKGKGVSFMEDARSWHSDVISPEQYARALTELESKA